MSVSAINYLHTPIMSHQENVDLWDRPAMKCEKKRRGAITPTSNAAQHRRKSDIWWLGQSRSLWKWSFGCERWLLPHMYVDSYTSAVFLMGKCNYFSVPLSQTISGLHWIHHWQSVLPLWGSHTHSWHSVEIFSSLVLPRKILTRAPKFPVLGLFSTWGGGTKLYY